MEAQKFGKYEVVEKIGEGGFGEVFKGHDPTLKRFVAIKTCKSGSREFLDRFLLEAEISARLQHPNIVTIYDFGYRGETPYLVQEYLAGEDLDRKIRQRAAMDFGTKLDVLRQAAVGLRHAHHRGIVHRDVKPANVRVLEDGRVKIMDFGIAKLLSSEIELTQTGMTLGTARYQAPEQFQGDKIDLRADIFSFGVTAYELLTYERPFDGDSVARIFYRITQEDPRPIHELWPECPASLESCVDQCLSKDPTHRYSDLAPVIGVLEAFGAPPGSGSYMTAPAPGPPPPPPPPPPAPSGSAAAVSRSPSPLSGSEHVETLLMDSGASSADGSVSGADDSAPLQRSRAGRIGAFAVVALVAFAVTYGVGRLLRDREAPTGEVTEAAASHSPEVQPPASGSPAPPPAGSSSEGLPGEPESGDPAAVPAGGVAIIEPAAPVRRPLAGPEARGSDPDRAEVREPVQTRPVPPPPAGTRPSRLPSAPSPPSPAPGLEPDPPGPAGAAGSRTPALAPPASTQPVPRAVRRGAVVLYESRDFGGPGESFTGDDADLSDNSIGNDAARSVQVDAGCRVELFADAGFSGRVTVLNAHRADLRGTEVGQRQASSLRVECRAVPVPAAGGRGAVLYVHGDFRGPSELLRTSDPDLADNSIGDDTVSSLRVMPGCRVRLFRKAGFEGQSTLLEADAAGLDGTEVGNDQVSSVEVECQRPSR